MKFVETFIKDLIIIHPNVFEDNRGWFKETYNSKIFEQYNISLNFIQDNHSLSLKKGVLRGLHFQLEPKAQTKLVRCTRGKIWDVAVDLRKNSDTYLKWFGLELSSTNHLMLLIPKGFAHGFITLEDESEVQYKVDNFYDKSLDRSLNFMDEIIGIEWPKIPYILSEKDKNAPSLSELEGI